MIVVSPIDLIPDFIPVAGYIDDAAVIVFVPAQIKADLDNILQWEAEHKKDKSLQRFPADVVSIPNDVSVYNRLSPPKAAS
jgi:uncharacterized membrane protein YkvA (DUF1232 family)